MCAKNQLTSLIKNKHLGEPYPGGGILNYATTKGFFIGWCQIGNSVARFKSPAAGSLKRLPVCPYGIALSVARCRKMSLCCGPECCWVACGGSEISLPQLRMEQFYRNKKAAVGSQPYKLSFYKHAQLFQLNVYIYAMSTWPLLLFFFFLYKSGNCQEKSILEGSLLSPKIGHLGDVYINNHACLWKKLP